MDHTIKLMSGATLISKAPYKHFLKNNYEL
jgi:hypothetical protein